MKQHYHNINFNTNHYIYLFFYSRIMAKTQITLLVLILGAALTLYSLRSSQAVEHSQFQMWKHKYGKHYSTSEQETFRMRVWLSNLAFVEAHNARHKAGLQTFDVEMNAFADLNSEEFQDRYLMKNFPKKITSSCSGAQPSTKNLPTEVDWSSKGAVTSIKNQGQCGSCWAFSATGALEAAYFRQKNQLLSFSEKQLVDCSRQYGNDGCNGGLMNASFFYVRDHGITTEDKYPYSITQGSCKYNESKDKVWSISDCTDVNPGSEAGLMGAIAFNPVSVAVEAKQLFFQFYRSGVFNNKCGNDIDHGVLAVGYGVMNGTKHYKIKNSWGDVWGMNGYMYIIREGDGDGKCGIQMAPSIPIA